MAKFPKCSSSDAKKARRCEKKVVKTIKPKTRSGRIIKNPTKKQKRSAAIAVCTVSIGCSVRTRK